MKYDADKDFKTIEDLFEPVTLPIKDQLRIPADLEVEFIGKENDIPKM